MTYLRRALKYFLQICIIFVVIIGVLMLTGFISKDVGVAFQQRLDVHRLHPGRLLPLVSLAYPLSATANGPSTPRETRRNTGRHRRRHGIPGYVKAGETEDGGRKYHSHATFNRVMRLWEDSITIEPVLGGFQAEGLVRDLARIVSAIDHKINTYGN